MHGFPFGADSLKDQRHATRSGVRLALESLRLSPKTRHNRAISSEHLDVLVTNVELYLLRFRKGALAILSQLIPPLGDRAVVVKKNEVRRIPVTARIQANIRALDALNYLVEGGEYPG